ncbi:hypothetical protein DBB29_01910 [Pandoraea cepalis]|uniref:ABC transporter domain-containing protein n=1 Tax=Pandoraea cepalis TaxID=2508294 RepID=A0AAW7MHN7_9BURK|nr:amino acid ABC transporter ATP-binding protein [Pandoraea cepalis]MDN4572272.1 hypothetical protein [Pandoraea cepalis]MDN4576879.1 hypothetical protein [Pandoraea cepalis]
MICDPVTTSANALLDVRNVTKRYGDTEVLKGVSLRVHAREVVGIIGSSGSGKSTLLRCINFLEPPTSGEILLDGERIGVSERRNDRNVALSDRQLSLQRRDIAMVFQRFNLWPHRTILENVIEALVTVHRVPRAKAVDIGMAQLARVSLTEKANAYPNQLSGGQQQRVGIARALAVSPKLILFDEPTSALDPELVGTVLDTMSSLAAEGLTMVVVTHEMSFAREICDKILFVDQGVVADEGPPAHIFGKTTNRRTLTFLDRYLNAERSVRSGDVERPTNVHLV